MTRGEGHVDGAKRPGSVEQRAGDSGIGAPGPGCIGLRLVEG